MYYGHNISINVYQGIKLLVFVYLHFKKFKHTFSCSCSHSINCWIVTRKVDWSRYVVVTVNSRHHCSDVWMGWIRTFSSTINGFNCSSNFLYVSPWTLWIKGMSSTCKYSIPMWNQNLDKIMTVSFTLTFYLTHSHVIRRCLPCCFF